MRTEWNFSINVISFFSFLNYFGYKFAQKYNGVFKSPYIYILTKWFPEINLMNKQKYIRSSIHFVLSAKIIRAKHVASVRSLCNDTRELRQWRRRRRRRRVVKNEFIFYQRNSRLSSLLGTPMVLNTYFKLNMQRQRLIPIGNTKN